MAHSVARSIVALSPLPLRERGWRRRRLLRRRHPLPNPSPIKGEGPKATKPRCNESDSHIADAMFAPPSRE